MQPCRSPYCECDVGHCTHPGFYDARGADHALSLAIFFHDTYERLAPQYGYETRKDTKQFDPTTPNGKLMQAVCTEVYTHLNSMFAPKPQ